MNIRTVFAHALARRVAYVLVAAVLAFVGIGRAEAACRTGNACDTKAEAYDAVLYKGSDFCPVYGVPNGVETATYVETDVTATTGRVTAYYKCDGSTVAQASATWATVCPAGETWNPSTYTCSAPCSANAPPLGKTSLQVPAGTAENPWINTPSGACVNGCAFGGSIDKQSRSVIDGVQYVTYSSMEPTGQMCAAGEQGWFPPLTPPPDGDGDGTSDGNDSKPTNPGTGGTGEPGPDGQPPPDGTGNGSGQGSGNGNQSTGGGNCNTPPSSNGDAILAQIAYQAWATRCAVEALGKGKDSNGIVLPGTGTGGNGSGQGTGALGGCTEQGTLQGFACSGDPVGCVQAEAVARANCRGYAADKNGNGQPDWTEGEAPTGEPGEEDPEPGILGLGVGPSMLDTENIFGNGSCPAFSISIMGVEASSSDIPAWCDIVAIMRAVVLIMGAFTALGILMGRT